MSYKKQTFVNGQILEADHLNHMEEGISNAVVSPKTAKVGQTVVVKAVDDDGKPTEWESVDIPTTLPASDVSDWAKATTKPTYTAAEVGALPANTDIPSVDGLVSEKTLSETLEEYAKTEDVSKEENARKEEIAVERARIDKFTTLPEGSTTGDAELQDIRIGYDGTTYENAGTAVREQIKNVPRLEVGESSPTNDGVQLWINPDGDEEINVPEINDSEVNPEDTWSSEKINAELSQLSGENAELKSDLDDISEQISSGKCVINLSKYTLINNNATVDLVTNGINIITTKSYTGVMYRIVVLKNTNYKLQFDVSSAQGNAFVDVVTMDKIDSLAHFIGSSKNDVTLSFNSLENTELLLRLESQTNSANITFSNFEITNEITHIKQLLNYTPTTGLYNLDGTVNSEPSWSRYVDFFPLKSIKNITIPKYGIIICYDSDLKVIGNVQNLADSVMTEIDAPTKTVYIRMSWFNSSGAIKFELDNLVLNLINGSEKKHQNIYILDINGSGDFTDFETALLTCKTDDLLIIKKGVYEVIANDSKGPNLKCDIKAFKGAKIVCNYDGSDANIVSKFSPINMDTRNYSDITIDGLEIETQNTRYCIHDEMGGGYTNYIHTFKNCIMKHNSDASDAWNYPRCIGGGLGYSGRIVIENCKFECVISSAVDYHSDWNQGQTETDDCDVIIKDCFAPNNTFTSTCHGSNTRVLNKMYVSNCLVSELPHIIRESGKALNNTMYQWNNEISNT